MLQRIQTLRCNTQSVSYIQFVLTLHSKVLSLWRTGIHHWPLKPEDLARHGMCFIHLSRCLLVMSTCALHMHRSAPGFPRGHETWRAAVLWSSEYKHITDSKGGSGWTGGSHRKFFWFRLNKPISKSIVLKEASLYSTMDDICPLKTAQWSHRNKEAEKHMLPSQILFRSTKCTNLQLTPPRTPQTAGLHLDSMT